MKAIWFAVALATSTASMPLAAQSFNNSTQISSFTENSVRPVLNELKAQITGRDKLNDLERITIKFENGYVADIVMTACLEDGRCVGAKIEARWDRSSNFTQTQDMDFTAAFNLRYDFTKSGVNSDGKLLIQRYVIADRGISHGTFYDELLNFQALTKIFDDAQADRK